MSTGQQRLFAMSAAASGNLIEWFDFYIYSYCTIYFAPAFFPTGNPTTQLLNAAGIFAAGFLMRPLGAWFFGRLADRQGCRAGMMVSVLMMCGGSLLIAILPTYAQIGPTAPVLLLLARLLQGFSLGGEYGASTTYLSMVGPKGRRGFFASFQYLSLAGGQLLAVLAVLILQYMLTETQLKAWGWRLPFALGALGALVALWLRYSLNETALENGHVGQEAGTLRALWQHKRALFTAFGFTACGALTFYTFSTYMQKYLINTAGMPAKTVSMLMMSAMLVCLPLNLVFGALSDKIGQRLMMIIYSLLIALCTIPAMQILKTVSNPYIAFALVLSLLIILTIYTSINGLLKATLFPAEVRSLGVGLPYAIANTVFGGTAEYIALWLKSSGMESNFYWYVTAIAFISLCIALTMPDLRRHGYLRDE